MTQRNPMNERYQKDDRTGATRKSAASAKPVTEAGASVHKGGKPAKSRFERAKNKAIAADAKDRSNSREAKAQYYNPDTPEYRKWRKWWWGTIIAALVLTSASFAFSVFTPDNMWLIYGSLGAGYVVLFVAIWIDLGKVRKIRKQYRQSKVVDRSKAATRARKEERAKQRAKAQEMHELAEQGRKENAEKKERRREKRAGLAGRLGFGKGRKQP